MPQKAKKGLSWRQTPDAVGKRPKLAARIGSIVGLWSHLEWQRAIFLAAVLDIEAHIALTMYLSIENDGGKRAVLEAVLNERFPDLAEEFGSLSKKIAGTARERNKVIHGIWSTAETRPDTLLWEDTRKAAIVHGAAVTDIHRRIFSGPSSQNSSEVAMKKVDALLASAREYTENDFEQVEQRIKERIEEFRLFALKVYKQAKAVPSGIKP